MSKKKKRWIIAGSAVALFIITMLLVLDVGAWQKLDMNKLRNINQTTIVYADDGTPIAMLSGAEDRHNIPLEEIPGEVQLAFIAAEDARFYSHFGVDVWRIGGALVSNIKSGGYGQGASTITQQLIKLTHLSSEKTVSRKAQEAFLAVQLEWRASKEEILRDYLNVIYFGNGAYGIESAANKYFGISASELSLEQSALLAAIIKSPSKYAPHLYPDNALDRRNLVLDYMVEYEFITEERAAEAKNKPIEIVPQAEEENVFAYGWYVDAVMDEAEEKLSITADELISGGYRIYTSLNESLQKSAEELFTNDANFSANAADGTRAQAALVSVDVKSGEVLSLVGGRSYDARRGLNRATQIARQPGSAFKPISVYAAAIDRYGYVPVSFVDDTQRDFGRGYSPKNSGDTYRGLVTLRESLARSLNVATVDLLSRMDINSARQYAEKAGITLDKNDSNLSLALGSLTYGVSPVSLCAAYAPLANGGQSVDAHLIREIKDSNGHSVYRFSNRSTQVMQPQSAYMITDMLRSAASWGTASALSSLDFDVAGKTGTVAMTGGGNRDAWTVAYTPSVAVTVWMGFDQPDEKHKLSDANSGSTQPARLASAYLSKIKDRASAGNFEKPAGITEVLLDNKALTTLHKPMLASDLTPKSQIIKEVFPSNKVPGEVSNVWNAPSTVYDLTVTANEEGQPVIRFTALSSDALYLLYRRVDSKDTLVAELSGEAGEVIEYTDTTAEAGKEIEYYIIPVQKELYAEDKTLSGAQSMVVRFQSGNRFYNWISNELNGQQESEPPRATAPPEPTEEIPEMEIEAQSTEPTEEPEPTQEPEELAEEEELEEVELPLFW